MNLSSISIERPVLATVMSIVIIIFGVIGFTYLGIREYPSVDPPIISVSTNYTGASADVIESQITEPLEEGINGISGIRSLSSISTDGRSTITVEFELGEDLEAAANDVRDRVSQARRNLPPDADPPIVTKADADATTILALTVQSDQRSLLELSDIATNTFKERLQTIPGISNIRIWGDKRYAMRLQMDPAKLEAYRLTPLDVRNAVQEQNVELPTGNIEGYRSYLTIRTMGRLVTEDDYNEMIIKEEDGAVIKFKDIGKAVLDAENQRTLLRGNNKIPMVGVAVTPQPGANYIAIADEFYKRVDQIEKELPDDLKLGYALDTTLTIRKAITEVEETILIAFGLVVIVIFMFLRDWRTTLIPAIAIPISLIGAFFIMYFADFSINILTLLGIVLATGLVVDDAIVVLENIYQKIESGISPKKAAHEGSAEIYFAIISTTVTLAAVFLPIIFLEGVTGRLFREFGVVVAGSVLISAFVSLTLTPMMSSRLLKKKERSNRFYKVTERFFEWMTNGYNMFLIRFMKHRWAAIVIVVLSLGGIIGLGAIIPSELAPLEDKSRLRLFSTAPEGTSFELMDNYVMELLNVADTLQEKQSLIAVTSPGFGSSNSVNSSFLRITLKPPSERARSQQEIAQQLSGIVGDMNFARTFVVQEQTIQVGRSSGLPVQYVIQAPNLERLKEVLPDFVDEASQHPDFAVVDLDLKFNKPELAVTIDRERARALGVSVRDIAETIQLFFSGQRFDYFVMNGKQYQIIGEASRSNRDEPLDLSSISVSNDRGELITLNNLVNMETQSTSPQLYRYNRYVAATVSASPADGVTLGQGIAAMDEIADEVLDDSFSTALSGTSKDYQESSGSLYFAFGLALVLIYLVLAAQFESFIDPLIIMFTVPLALTGALLTLWLFGHTLNIFSQIGIIVLIGIVTKNGILIVEFANQRKEEGLNKFDAVIEAATIRLRPILMTSLATILGALPIALALGAASTSRIPMGMAIIGGLLFSLILTLVVIPVIYSFMSGKAPSKAKIETSHK
ncbi:hydrophobe/amphiphile efflux-1 (HAE1) family protein [Catalinimonas alkaloidigena]|uniref:efflux RND transporter permease subunit n=1 Tax=Catalinimonas alkaloidigena TaxID=1075417 RepID=UPI002406A64C|nr:efflux RND transporter permease subunit [Catalinimonas alkaloidigena]MDF9801123.1 hydrophobe/amphiphile efflux-1 (HAE1) family protein [Catalinimonas alkaloidigena]